MSDNGEFSTAILLGIVEGLTEFIPVSSTGHLILFGEALTYHGPAAETFEVFIQLGAILAVLFLYPMRFIRLLRFDSTGGFSGIQGLMKLFLACLPAFVLGFFFHSVIKGVLFHPLPVAIALIVGGVALIGVEKKSLANSVESIEDISFRQSFLIGCFQTLALWPGISRSGATILGGMWRGLERTVAAEFSFLVAVPVMFAATLFDLYKNIDTLGAGAFGELLTGFLVSLVVALIAIRTFIGFLKRFSLASFGWYRIVLGVVVLLILGL